MKNVKKILICLALVCCLSMGTIGCDKGDNTSTTDSNVSTDADTTQAGADGGDDNTQDTAEDNAQSEEQQTNADANEVTTSVADANNDVQETIALTDAEGNVVTDKDGNIVTQKVVNNDSNNNDTTQAVQTDADGNTVTNSANDTTQNNSSNDNNSNSNNSNDNNNNNSDDNNNSNDNNSDDNNDDDSIYFAKNAYTILLWMSEDTSNKYESGEMVELTFKVLDTAENGDYPVTFNYVEMYDTSTEAVPFTVQNGTITVGKDKSVTAQGAASEGANFRLDNATAQPGDTVKLKIYIDNNPGMALNKIELKYDSKAFEVQNITPVGGYSNEIIESNMNASKSTKK